MHRTRVLWTHPSVVAFAERADPVEAITEGARNVVTRALDAGWAGPPFDPTQLAAYLKLEVVPRDDVVDARTVPVGRTKARIEFNPNRPRGRVRYSVAHEIAHTLFPDWGQQIRERAAHRDLEDDEWQLEALCNIAAAEFLMPIGTLPEFSAKTPGVDRLMELRRQFDVSTEALFIRAAHLADEPCSVFCASRIEGGRRAGAYRLDYMIGSPSWPTRVTPRGTAIPDASVVYECNSIGFTAKGQEKWPGEPGPLHVECVGIPPYPGSRFPRVMGILKGASPGPDHLPGITYLKGDATEPRGPGPKFVAHVVNEATPNWGGHGFAVALRRRWRSVQRDFHEWAVGGSKRLALGNVHVAHADEAIRVVTMIGQKGYGPSRRPRIRYAALRACLTELAKIAAHEGATVHMPRIGCGQGGGSWAIVQELISSSLCRSGVRVFVYDLPGTTVAEEAQKSLDFGVT